MVSVLMPTFVQKVSMPFSNDHTRTGSRRLRMGRQDVPRRPCSDHPPSTLTARSSQLAQHLVAYEGLQGVLLNRLFH